MSNNKNNQLIELGEIPAEYGEDDRETVCDEDPIEIDDEDPIEIDDEDPIEVINEINVNINLVKIKMD